MPNCCLNAAALMVLSALVGANEPARIGDKIGVLNFTDIRYLPRTLADLGDKKAFVLVFVNTTCPLAKRYLPTLQAMEREYRAKEVQFVGVDAAQEDSIVAMATLAVEHGIEFPFVRDFSGDCARSLGVRRTPEAVILDGEHRLRYRGRIDDQYRLGGARPTPSQHDLKNALEALLAGKAIDNAETPVDGCPITLPATKPPREVTFAEDVAPVLQKHCWACHHEGGPAPFSLTGFQQVSAHAEAVAEVVAQGRMPPWFARHEFGPFTNRRGLSDRERDTILDWARSGKASGDLAKAPTPPAPAENKWRIGEPDLVVTAAAHELPASGDIPYQYSILPYIFAADTWIQDVQILPDNPRVLHHSNLAYANLAEGFNESNFITGNVPGGETMNLPAGIGFLIPKGSVLGLQTHYVTTGKPEKCRVSVGLRFPRGVVNQQLRHVVLSNSRFAIPPGAPAHKVAASRVLDRDIVCIGLFSHMHLRGKDMTFTAHLPGGDSETLLVIANYSFSWQVPYRWEPGQKRLPKGTRVECVAHFDNSTFNPYNPDPKATVRNGPQTHHEMMFGYFFFVGAGEQLGISVDPKTGIERR